ncbi:hypothetical protein SAMN06264364_1156 [Quadrisphaera granulorum]|uniref:PIN domain-containing protein n=1 Tax=Quadrisphaera granulorum TaxID=317664 RepID=A0A316A649_9ACTN|nr:hypothetical protein [Quadrisphaera granulorum]PWJ52989.1 hypothetical protein BXY45_1156 [Quadrisphaera granulorum]SZE97154.1 hypothetical protein SAMN06264364_1156 [Quadrisphaera granulorum]
MILVDTNVLVAMSSRRDRLHDAAMALMISLPPGQGVLPTVLAETAYLINEAGGSGVERQFVRGVDRDFTLVTWLSQLVMRRASGEGPRARH